MDKELEKLIIGERKLISYDNLVYFIDKLVDLLDERYSNLIVHHDNVNVDDVKGIESCIIAYKKQKDQWDSLIGHTHMLQDIVVTDDKYPEVTNLEELFDQLFHYASNFRDELVRAVTGLMPDKDYEVNNMIIEEIINYIEKLPCKPLEVSISYISYKPSYIEAKFDTCNGIFEDFGIADVDGNINWRGTTIKLNPDTDIEVWGRTKAGTLINGIVNPGINLYGYDEPPVITSITNGKVLYEEREGCDLIILNSDLKEVTNGYLKIGELYVFKFKVRDMNYYSKELYMMYGGD